MSFASDLRKFTQKLERRNRRIFLRVTSEVDKSIRKGSALTGSPGQPVQTGFLRNSWETSFPSKTVSQVSTNCEYAEFIEDGGNSRGKFTLRSKVGGFHSVKLTRAGFQKIADHVTTEEFQRD